MKKLLALIMVVVLCLSLCACGGNKGDEAKSEDEGLSREEMLEQAEVVTATEMYAEANKNEVRAQELYKDKIVKIEYFQIYSISSSGEGRADLQMWGTGFFVDAYVPSEDASSLSKGDVVAVVGRVSSINRGFIKIADAYVVDR